MSSLINQGKSQSVHEGLVYILSAKVRAAGTVGVPDFVRFAESLGASKEAAHAAIKAAGKLEGVRRLRGFLTSSEST